mgnify:CR=1 FL=1|jgi:F-box domain.
MELSKEILCCIFKNLRFHDLIETRLVCSSWRDCTNKLIKIINKEEFQIDLRDVKQALSENNRSFLYKTIDRIKELPLENEIIVMNDVIEQAAKANLKYYEALRYLVAHDFAFDFTSLLVANHLGDQKIFDLLYSKLPKPNNFDEVFRFANVIISNINSEFFSFDVSIKAYKILKKAIIKGFLKKPFGRRCNAKNCVKQLSKELRKVTKEFVIGLEEDIDYVQILMDKDRIKDWKTFKGAKSEKLHKFLVTQYGELALRLMAYNNLEDLLIENYNSFIAKGVEVEVKWLARYAALNGNKRLLEFFNHFDSFVVTMAANFGDLKLVEYCYKRVIEKFNRFDPFVVVEIANNELELIKYCYPRIQEIHNNVYLHKFEKRVVKASKCGRKTEEDELKLLQWYFSLGGLSGKKNTEDHNICIEAIKRNNFKTLKLLRENGYVLHFNPLKFLDKPSLEMLRYLREDEGYKRIHPDVLVSQIKNNNLGVITYLFEEYGIGKLSKEEVRKGKTMRVEKYEWDKGEEEEIDIDPLLKASIESGSTKMVYLVFSIFTGEGKENYDYDFEKEDMLKERMMRICEEIIKRIIKTCKEDNVPLMYYHKLKTLYIPYEL